jgi:hypothetical protein
MIFSRRDLVGTGNGSPPLNWTRFLGRRRSQRMSEDERTYFQNRAEAEIELAQRAQHPGAVRSHYLLAGFYLDLVHGGAEQQPAT